MGKELCLSTSVVDFHTCIHHSHDLSKGLHTTQHSRMMGSLPVDSTVPNKQNRERNKRLILHSGFDHYVLQTILTGTLRGNFNGTDVFVHPGDIVIVDLSHLSSSTLEKDTCISVIIPRYDLEKLTGWRNLHGTVLKSRAPTTCLLFNYVKEMVEISAKLNATETIAAKDAMLILLTSCINGSKQSFGKNLAINPKMRHRILAYIDDNLTDPQLKPRSIQQHFNVSRSHLYRSFEPDGGVAKVIRDKRLRLAYRLLIETQGKQPSLKEITYHCGFPDASQFTKTFKKHYGITPKNARETRGVISSDSYSIAMDQNYLTSQNEKAEVKPDRPAKPPHQI